MRNGSWFHPYASLSVCNFRFGPTSCPRCLSLSWPGQTAEKAAWLMFGTDQPNRSQNEGLGSEAVAEVHRVVSEVADRMQHEP